MTATIRADHFYNHAPARVWRALTDPTLAGRWMIPSDFKAELGHHFTYDMGQWGTVHCEVLAIEPERLLSTSWKNPPLDTVVTWRLVPEGAGTRLYLEHSGFDLDHPVQRMAFEGMTPGWEKMMTERLPGVLAGVADGTGAA